MKNLDDGPDGLNDAAFDRMLGLAARRDSARRAVLRSARRQRAVLTADEQLVALRLL